VPTAPPVLGQHTDEILKDVLGLTPERIEALRASKVVA
jgi:crotonobetainyl-CoA:carnitine CoA-transferase CaiB-like acyl-CoA transferase